MADYTPAPQVRRLADDLILDHHKHLMGVPIRYVFVDPVPTSKGKQVWGRARKVSGLNAFLAAGVGEDEIVHEDSDWSFFVIEIARDIWDHLEPAGRRALVDHELCHCDIGEDSEGNRKLVTRAHDVEEFQEVVRRHGLWRSDVERFASAVQLTLTGDAA